MSGVFWFSMGVMCTVALLVVVRKRTDYLRYKVPFVEILNLINDNKIGFFKRFGGLAYFSGYKNYLIIYNIKKQSISVHDDDNCVHITSESNQELTDEIIDKLDSRFYDDIYKKISVINGVVYSNNVIDSNMPDQKNTEKPIDTTNGAEPMIKFVLKEDIEEEEEDVFNIDEIIRKIKESGRDSLTDEEKNFIDDVDNWNK